MLSKSNKTTISAENPQLNCGKTNTFVVISADSQGTCITERAPPYGRAGSWCANHVGQTFEAILVIATAEHARPTAASDDDHDPGSVLRSVHIDNESPSRAVQRIPARKHQQRATTNGHRCNWVIQRCWCAEAATSCRAIAPELRHQAGCPLQNWECPPSDR